MPASTILVLTGVVAVFAAFAGFLPGRNCKRARFRTPLLRKIQLSSPRSARSNQRFIVCGITMSGAQPAEYHRLPFLFCCPTAHVQLPKYELQFAPSSRSIRLRKSDASSASRRVGFNATTVAERRDCRKAATSPKKSPVPRRTCLWRNLISTSPSTIRYIE